MPRKRGFLPTPKGFFAGEGFFAPQKGFFAGRGAGSKKGLFCPLRRAARDVREKWPQGRPPPETFPQNGARTCENRGKMATRAAAARAILQTGGRKCKNRGKMATWTAATRDIPPKRSSHVAKLGKNGHLDGRCPKHSSKTELERAKTGKKWPLGRPPPQAFRTNGARK